MKPLACRYAIVQFMPYAETGEFANVGVVLCLSADGLLRLQAADPGVTPVSRRFR